MRVPSVTSYIVQRCSRSGLLSVQSGHHVMGPRKTPCWQTLVEMSSFSANVVLEETQFSLVTICFFTTRWKQIAHSNTFTSWPQNYLVVNTHCRVLWLGLWFALFYTASIMNLWERQAASGAQPLQAVRLMLVLTSWSFRITWTILTLKWRKKKLNQKQQLSCWWMMVVQLSQCLFSGQSGSLRCLGLFFNLLGRFINLAHRLRLKSQNDSGTNSQ